MASVITFERLLVASERRAEAASTADVPASGVVQRAQLGAYLTAIQERLAELQRAHKEPERLSERLSEFEERVDKVRAGEEVWGSAGHRIGLGKPVVAPPKAVCFKICMRPRSYLRAARCGVRLSSGDAERRRRPRRCRHAR